MTSNTKKIDEFIQNNLEEGYISPCEQYAAVPFGNQFIVIHNGYQIRTCRTLTTAKNFINQEKKKIK